jgi:hypothetical protein
VKKINIMDQINIDQYAAMLMSYTDDQLAHQMGMIAKGGGRYEQVKFEMERRILLAQKAATEATLRSAISAERYTKATWFIILVTAIGVIFNAIEPVIKVISYYHAL